MASYYGIVKTGEHLKHYGVLGMKWGVRRYQPYSTVPRGSGKTGKFIGSHKEGRKENKAAKTTPYSSKGMRLDRSLQKKIDAGLKTGNTKKIARNTVAQERLHNSSAISPYEIAIRKKVASVHNRLDMERLDERNPDMLNLKSMLSSEADRYDKQAEAILKYYSKTKVDELPNNKGTYKEAMEFVNRQNSYLNNLYKERIIERKKQIENSLTDKN